MMIVHALSSPISFFSVTLSWTFCFFFSHLLEFCPSMSFFLDPVCSYGVLQVPPVLPVLRCTYYSFKNERAALAQQPGTGQGRMLNTQMAMMHSWSPEETICDASINDFKSRLMSVVLKPSRATSECYPGDRTIQFTVI